MSQRTNFALASAALVAALLQPRPAAAASLGRLFFTAGERTELEYRWQASQGRGSVSDPALSGLVWRSDSRSTLWLDGVPLYQKSAPMRLDADRRDPSRIDLRLGGRPPLHLRVGDAPR